MRTHKHASPEQETIKTEMFILFWGFSPHDKRSLFISASGLSRASAHTGTHRRHHCRRYCPFPFAAHFTRVTLSFAYIWFVFHTDSAHLHCALLRFQTKNGNLTLFARGAKGGAGSRGVRIFICVPSHTHTHRTIRHKHNRSILCRFTQQFYNVPRSRQRN